MLQVSVKELMRILNGSEDLSKSTSYLTFLHVFQIVFCLHEFIIETENLYEELVRDERISSSPAITSSGVECDLFSVGLLELIENQFSYKIRHRWRCDQFWSEDCMASNAQMTINDDYII
uniref:Uncharacterized protein n=1 Tax=Strigamia maritima TaxID=126957 RepID=T1IU87_STRMM